MVKVVDKIYILLSCKAGLGLSQWCYYHHRWVWRQSEAGLTSEKQWIVNEPISRWIVATQLTTRVRWRCLMTCRKGLSFTWQVFGSNKKSRRWCGKSRGYPCTDGCGRPWCYRVWGTRPRDTTTTTEPVLWGDSAPMQVSLPPSLWDSLEICFSSEPVSMPINTSSSLLSPSLSLFFFVLVCVTSTSLLRSFLCLCL